MRFVAAGIRLVERLQRRRRWCLALLALAAAAGPARARSSRRAGRRDVSLAEYQQHLDDLDGVVAACQAQRRPMARRQRRRRRRSSRVRSARLVPTTACSGAAGRSRAKSATTGCALCWARAARRALTPNPTASRARCHDAKNASIAAVDALLAEARERLQDDAKQAESTTGAEPRYAGERKSLNAILAQRAYQGVTEISATERFLEWLYNLLDKFLCRPVCASARARRGSGWRCACCCSLAICTGLVWSLVRIERRSRIRLIPDVEPAPERPRRANGSYGSSDAQRWPRKGSGARRFTFFIGPRLRGWSRERLWPADRARTPREYLALLAGTDPRKPSLTALTGALSAPGMAAARRSLRLPCRSGAGRSAGGGGGMKLFASLDAKDRKLLHRLPGRGACAGSRHRIFGAQRKQRRQSCAQLLFDRQAWRARRL